MRILYLAHGIPIPGHIGGSTHALEVARGLARRGHDVHLVAARSHSLPLPSAITLPWRSLGGHLLPIPYDGFSLYYHDIPKQMAIAGAWPIFSLVRALRPDVIMERYYNFGGAGIWAAHRFGIPSMLEVNALIVDPPVILKRRLDDALGGPMRRWATTQCQWATTIVTPLHTTIPHEISRQKIVELPWGANVDRVTPLPQDTGIYGDDDLPSPPPSPPYLATLDAPIVVFLGSFRAWHGVHGFVQAAGRLLEQGVNAHFVLIGDGPERASAERYAATWPRHIHLLGAMAHERVAQELPYAHIGVAPFTTTPHPALRAAGFFWSPLKVYEYMAAGLPVVTTNIHPLNTIIREGQEGMLFAEDQIDDLARAIGQLVAEPETAMAMGRRGRERVVAHYSWQRHCTELEQHLLHAL